MSVSDRKVGSDPPVENHGHSALEAVLVIRGFVIRGFDYSSLMNCVQNLLSTDISLGYPRILYILVTKMT